MTSQENLDYVQSLPDLVEEYEQESAQLNHTFSQGFYLGSQNEAKKHWLYFAGGMFLGSIGSILYWIDYLVGGIVK